MRTWLDRPGRRSGFTLIELVLVVTIIAILAGAVVVQASKQTRKARRARALSDIRSLETALDIYTADNNTPPTTQQGLEALRKRPTSSPVPRNWDGPYIKKPVGRDPWGNPYVYRYPAQQNPDPEGYDLICYAADGQPGGDGDAADITNFGDEEE